ncbi:ankyrin [Ascodesmis nigricans]|uniref:Palmitoyltransferase n=1 Tax=Ascodesmis nigricans TaxID=341454 RepID=A0A4S2N173_9PEZI|nr:ankyrin [Ascodesmis nigricans]
MTSSPVPPAGTSTEFRSAIPRTLSLLQTSTKSSAVPAAVDTEVVELRDMAPSALPAELDLKDDIMKLAITGDEVAIRELLDSGKATATHTDADGITPLHWAAINNRYAVVKLLLDRGADPNAHGGENDATPAMWAAQRGHYYVVHLLISYGADGNMVDSSGYNLLHLATFDGNVFLLTIVLHAGVPVDSRDPNQHTPLMWAGYKGFPACVDLFLRWGADIHAVDDSGLSALHWALVRGNYSCIERLVEYGADRFLPTHEGKVPATVAAELKTEKAWHDALEECGYDINANPINPPNTILGFQVADKDAVLRRFFFLWPTVEIIVIVMILAALPWFLGIPSALAVGTMMHVLGSKALRWAKPGEKAMHKTPYLAGIFAGTAFWVAVRYLWRIFTNTFTTVPISNLLFIILFTTAIYFYFKAMNMDPGFVPKPTGLAEQKHVVGTLIGEWKYDAQNFCTQCMIRRPLRSKHCRACDRCVARHDHHCPWIFNCVGARNHRHFLVYVAALELGIALLLRIAWIHFSFADDTGFICSDLTSPRICSLLRYDSYTFLITIWAAFQLTWVTMLIFVQLFQIARAKTTYESMHQSSYNHHSPHHHHGHGNPHSHNSTIDPAPHSHIPHTPFFRRITKILGIDAFITTAKTAPHGHGNLNRAKRNPYQSKRGVRGNCEDFWGGDWKDGMKGTINGEKVDWGHVYEIPRFGIRMVQGDRAAERGIEEERVGLMEGER